MPSSGIANVLTNNTKDIYIISDVNVSCSNIWNVMVPSFLLVSNKLLVSMSTRLLIQILDK